LVGPTADGDDLEVVASIKEQLAEHHERLFERGRIKHVGILPSRTENLN
jgi:hypothetical protein